MADSSNKPVPRDVALWMVSKIELDGELYQVDAAELIYEQFGDDFTYENENGNLAIDKGVLTEFRKLSDNSVVWERGTRMWRKRNSGDEPGRQQY